MKSYLDIAKNILDNGTWKENRTGKKALTTFGETFRHDMSQGFPLITTKKMPLRTIAVELEGFIGGITDKEWYQQRGCNIWNEWANPSECKRFYHINYVIPYEREREEHGPGGCMGIDDFGLVPYEAVRPFIQKTVTDLGPIYGYQWRRFNQRYFSGINTKLKPINDEYDQLNTVIKTLKEDPNNRRLLISAWNPSQIHLMALPPCHYAMEFVHIDGTLSLTWKQRSCDLFLGVPFNIASYALLLLLVCKETNLRPGILKGDLDDCQIYEDHIEQMKEQINREPKSLPDLEILDRDFSIFNWTHKDIKLHNYDSHPKLTGKVAV